MAFLVEDGTGVEDANAYVTKEYVEEYLTDRNRISEWTGTDAEKEAAIIRATDYIEKRFRSRFLGQLYSTAQGLSWPRSYYYNSLGVAVTGIPTELKKATAEYAVRILANGELWTDPTNGELGVSGLIKRKREKIGPIEEETEYVSSGVNIGYSIPSYPAADLLLSALIVSGGSVYR